MAKSANIKENDGNMYRPIGMVIIAFFMIIAGLAEIVTGFSHHFFSITTSGVKILTLASSVIGSFYVIAGLFIMTMKRWAATIAIILLCADITGRIIMVVTGLYPINSFIQIFAIIAGTLIAAVIVLYIRLKWKLFR